MSGRSYSSVMVLAGLSVLCAPAVLFAQGEGPQSGFFHQLAGLDPENLSLPVRGLLVVTVLGVVPSIVLLTTCFPRIVIVLSFLRRALGTQELPPNLVVMGLSLLLTLVVMLPVWKEVYDQAYAPLVEKGSVSTEEALRRAERPIKRFMLSHTLRNDRDSLRLFVELSRASEDGDTSPPTRLEDLDFFTVLPAFVLSELKVAFQMGFLIYLPFVLIDLVVSAVLVSMGMFMLPPNLVSLPLKVLVFVLVDGWTVVVTQLASGF